LIAAFAERGIEWHPNMLVRELDPVRKVARFADGTELAYDLFLAIPVHRVPEVVAQSGMTVDGWIPVDPLTLETSYPGVFAVGDVTSVGTPKAGSFAESQAAVAAERIAAMARDEVQTSQFDGKGLCYLEFGHGEVARVAVTFVAGEQPQGSFDPPSMAIAEAKREFGTDRIKRWFGRSWEATPS